MNRAKGSTVIAQQGTGALEKEDVVMQLKAGEKLLYRAGHLAAGGVFLIF